MTAGRGLADTVLHVPDARGMENLYQMLMNVNEAPARLHTWRAQLMRMLSEGGISLGPEEAKSDDSRMFVEARESYARKLKDKFLSGSARFLLQQSQDVQKIEKLENRLLYEIDTALRYSGQIWSRQDPLRFRGLSDLPSAFSINGPSGKLMELCLAQAPAEQDDESSSSSSYPDGNSVIMAIQPTVETIKGRRSSSDLAYSKDASRVWSKARVLVAAPKVKPQPAPAPASRQPSNPSHSRHGSLSSQASQPITFAKPPAAVRSNRPNKPSHSRRGSMQSQASQPVTYSKPTEGNWL